MSVHHDSESLAYHLFANSKAYSCDVYNFNESNLGGFVPADGAGACPA